MDDKSAILQEQLYAACEDAAAGNPKKLFTQQDLMALDVVTDVKMLMPLIQLLTNDRLLAPVRINNSLAWRVRSQVEASKYKLLSTEDQRLVYEIIDDADTAGSWQQDIKRRLNIQDNALRRTLKELEAKKLVKEVHMPHQGPKKMWFKFSIVLGDKATGGPWYTDASLDEAFIEALQGVIMTIVKDRGSYWSKGGSDRNARSVSPVLPKKGVINGAASEAALKSKKRSVDAISQDDALLSIPPAKTRKAMRIPLPAGYARYPTTDDITAAIQAAGISKGKPLTSANVQELIKLMILDGRIEEIKIGSQVAYRAVRISKHTPSLEPKPISQQFWESPTNGLTTVPCGRCPVFDLCEEGGPVWAGGCEYFDQWLA
ncbi:DNA-directed RNA polymerase III subunit RPC6 [Xylariaceae sp. FL0016]|nr:DNA-directed RNA polymerase III subunit RPC6 [Xylariaceae sp. FL0016]